MQKIRLAYTIEKIFFLAVVMQVSLTKDVVFYRKACQLKIIKPCYQIVLREPNNEQTQWKHIY